MGVLVAVGTVPAAINNEAVASSITQIRVTPDGSFNPPGDRLEIEVVVPPSAPQLSLEVRAFVVSGAENERFTPVRAVGDINRDANGIFLLRSNLKKAENVGAEETPANKSETNRLTAKIVVPYAQLDIPIGDHLFGYEVRLVHNETVVETCLTKLYPVVITEKSRKLMAVNVQKSVPVMESVKTKAFVVRGNEPKLEDFLLKRTTIKPVFETSERVVDIPGGWERPAMKCSAAAPGDPEGFFRDLADSPWFPLRKATVFYGTNRKVENADELSSKRYGDAVAQTVQYGSCLVNIPVRHIRGTLEVPDWWNPWARNDPRKHFNIDTLTVLSDESFTSALRTRMVSEKRDVLVFVHGFGTPFDDAVLKLAQLAYDIDFRGMPLAFSWPSEGVVSLIAYKRDEKKAAASASSLAKTLSLLVQERQSNASKAGKIHIIAHSMGNRVLLDALHAMKPTLDGKDKPFENIIFVAPDVDVNDFVARFAPVANVAESASLYFCPVDMALRTSKRIHDESVVGLRWLFLDPLENIDATNADTSFLGHSYYNTSREMLIDLQLLITDGLRPPKRATLRPAKALQHEYWLFP